MDFSDHNYHKNMSNNGINIENQTESEIIDSLQPENTRLKSIDNNMDSKQIKIENISDYNSNSAKIASNYVSIGKTIFETEDLEEFTKFANNYINNDFNFNIINTDSSSDDIEFIGNFPSSSGPGPSGPNCIVIEEAIETITDCDKSHSSNRSSTFEVNNCEITSSNANSFETNSEIIVIDDNDVDDRVVTNNDRVVTNDDSDIEVIQVKYFNEPEVDDTEIQVLSQIMTPNEVIESMKRFLRVTQQITNLSFTTLRLVLNSYEWQTDHFINEYMEYGIARINQTLKYVFSKELKTNSKRRKTSQKSETTCVSVDERIPCIICFDEINKSEMYGPSCGHFLCIDCWNGYISTIVNESSAEDKIICPNDDCSLIIDDDDLIEFVIQDQNIKDKYQRLISNKYVNKDKCLRWCPNGSCLHAVKVKRQEYQDIECICKTVFCFLCGNQWHEPLDCQMYQKWIVKYDEEMIDKKSAQWLVKHTKICPKCKFPIEKAGGCNYILCAKCKNQFCYYCLGKCSHGKCSGLNPNDGGDARLVDERTKQDIKIFPFYRDNYQTQEKKLSIERKLQEGVAQKLEKNVKCRQFKTALKFIKSAFGVLCHCRQTLMYSFVFGYYLVGPQDQIQNYTDLLLELERSTIELSQILTQETTVIYKESVFDMKQRVQSSYRNCESKRSELVEFIRNGFQSNAGPKKWQFFD